MKPIAVPSRSKPEPKADDARIPKGNIAPRRSQLQLRFSLTTVFLATLLASSGRPVAAVSCIPQGEMKPADLQALLAAATPLAESIAAQNFDSLRASLLPAVTGDWESIRNVAQSGAPLLKGGALHWRNAYLLDAPDLTAPTDAQFFCTNADSSTTVTINLHNLPKGRYALLMADYPGAPMAGQLGMILGFDTQWKLGGLFIREGALEGHDGIWYWNQARDQAKKSSGWDAWFSYDVARWLLLPLDFLSSPNLERLNAEQMRLKGSPIDSLPITAKAIENSPAAGKSWKITALHLDTTLHEPDLGLVYEGTGLTDPAASRAEATAVMSSLLRLHPELRPAFTVSGLTLRETANRPSPSNSPCTTFLK